MKASPWHSKSKTHRNFTGFTAWARRRQRIWEAPDVCRNKYGRNPQSELRRQNRPFFATPIYAPRCLMSLSLVVHLDNGAVVFCPAAVLTAKDVDIFILLKRLLLVPVKQEDTGGIGVVETLYHPQPRRRARMSLCRLHNLLRTRLWYCRSPCLVTSSNVDMSSRGKSTALTGLNKGYE